MAKATETKPARTKGRTDIRYFHDGMSMSEGHKHKLSTVAYFYSHDLDPKSPVRVGTKDFIAALVKAGVKDPGAPGWMVKLPNGVTIECRVDGDKSQFKGEPAARRTKATASSTAKKSPAKKAASGPKGPAGRDRADARAATKKAPAAKKATTAKKATPKSAAAKRPTRAN